nr:hypothetical protein [Myxococcus xanthus]
MKRPQPDGTTHLLFTGLELLRRLASLVPPPRLGQTSRGSTVSSLTPRAMFRTGWGDATRMARSAAGLLVLRSGGRS